MAVFGREIKDGLSGHTGHTARRFDDGVGLRKARCGARALLKDAPDLIFEEAKSGENSLTTGKRKRLLEHAAETESALFGLRACLIDGLPDAFDFRLCLSIGFNGYFRYELRASQCHLLIPVSDLLPLSLAVQVVQSFELPPLRHIHEFPRLAIAILCYLKAHPILRRLPIRAIGSDPASQRDPFKACI